MGKYRKTYIDNYIKECTEEPIDEHETEYIWISDAGSESLTEFG